MNELPDFIILFGLIGSICFLAALVFPYSNT